jgi:hypothetical protein
MRYSLRRALSLDSVDGGTHNPKVGGSNPPPATKPNTPVCGNAEYRRIGVSTKQIPRSLGNVVPAFPIFGGGHPNGTQVACNSCFAKRLFDELKVVRLSDEAQLAELEFSETQEE